MPDFCLTAGFVGHKCPTYFMRVTQATHAFYSLKAALGRLKKSVFQIT